MTPSVRRIIGALLFLLMVPGTALGLEPSTAQSFVARMTERATSVLASGAPIGEREAQLRDMLDEAFDLGYIGRLVLGPPYRSLSADQQQAYDAAFESYVLETYARRIDDYGGESVEVIGAEPAGSRDVKVQTRVVGGSAGEPVRIDWRVRDRAEGPKVIDVEIEGVSMAISQRSEFASVVQQRGIDGLIALLEERSAPPS